MARRFKDGQAVCNVRKLKAHVSHLKQVIFGGDSRPLHDTRGCKDAEQSATAPAGSAAEERPERTTGGERSARE